MNFSVDVLMTQEYYLRIISFPGKEEHNRSASCCTVPSQLVRIKYL
uniref:Uncharacterized protein n=1 Tax=Arundo donax TaxID=35708 RepID=A0A0A9Q482_ARUDO